MSVLNILVVDDDPGFIQRLGLGAPRNRCCLVAAGSLEEAQQLVTELGMEAFDGVILDIRCLKTKDQQVESPGFLSAALDYFKAMAPDLPRLVVTAASGIVGDFNEIFPTEEVMDKAKASNDDIFAFLWQRHADLPRAGILRKYADVFRVFELGYLDYKAREELLRLLLGEDDRSDTAFRDHLASVRRIQEALYRAMARQNDRWIPPGPPLFDDRTDNLLVTRVLNHLRDTQLHEGFVKQFAFCVYHVTSDSGAHRSETNPTRYTVDAAVSMLLDLILWFGALMDAEREKQRGGRASR